MALIDTLPLFRMKPLDIEPPVPRLLPRPDNTAEERQSDAAALEEKSKELPPPTAATPTFRGSATPELYQSYDPVVKALEKSGITNRDAVAAVVAQLGQESGWSPKIKDFNYGNITTGSSWRGPYSVRGDKDAEGNPIQQKFRSYQSPEAFVTDYLDLLKTSYPRSYRELFSDKFNIDNFVSGLLYGKRRYAEDRQYDTKLKATYGSVVKRFSENNT
jgi:hypothetical protein